MKYWERCLLTLLLLNCGIIPNTFSEPKYQNWYDFHLSRGTKLLSFETRSQSQWFLSSSGSFPHSSPFYSALSSVNLFFPLSSSLSVIDRLINWLLNLLFLPPGIPVVKPASQHCRRRRLHQISSLNETQGSYLVAV